MSKSLKRLLVLRERLKKVAESNLHASFSARAREVACTEENQPARHLGVQDAGSLLLMQERKEAAFARIDRIDHLVVEQQQLLGLAKREHRQIEKLVEGHTERQADKALRYELREQEDWVRTQSHKGDDT